MTDYILMPVEIRCIMHDLKLSGEYNELKKRFEIYPCKQCEDDAYHDGYDQGYNRGFGDCY